jgi:hypothetical protein
VVLLLPPLLQKKLSSGVENEDGHCSVQDALAVSGVSVKGKNLTSRFPHYAIFIDQNNLLFLAFPLRHGAFLQHCPVFLGQLYEL